MDMLTNEQIAAAGLAEWRKLAQGLHARYVVDSFPAAARFMAEVAAVGQPQSDRHAQVAEQVALDAHLRDVGDDAELGRPGELVR